MHPGRLAIARLGISLPFFQQAFTVPGSGDSGEQAYLPWWDSFYGALQNMVRSLGLTQWLWEPLKCFKQGMTEPAFCRKRLGKAERRRNRKLEKEPLTIVSVERDWPCLHLGYEMEKRLMMGHCQDSWPWSSPSQQEVRGRGSAPPLSLAWQKQTNKKKNPKQTNR